MIRYVSRLPKPSPHAARESYVSRDMNEFLRGDMPYARLDYEGRDPKNVCNAARQWLARKGKSRQVAVTVRGEGDERACYLVRTGGMRGPGGGGAE